MSHSTDGKAKSQSPGSAIRVRMVLLYWCRVFARGFKDTWQFLGHNLKKSIVSAITVLIAILLFGTAGDNPKSWPRVEWWLYGAAGAAALFVIVMIFMILRTPPLIQEEAVKKERDESRGRETGLQSRLEAMSAKIGELEKLVSESHKRQTNPLKVEGEKYIEKGKMIQGMLGEEDDRDKEGRADLLRWRSDLRAFVKASFPSEFNEFVKQERRPFPTFDGNHSALYFYLESEMQRLKDILVRHANRSS